MAMINGGNHENNQHETELLHAQAHVWNIGYNYVNSMSLKCVLQLGIPDIIHAHGGNKPMALSELVAAIPIHPTKADQLSRLLRILVHAGFFAVQKLSNGEEGYSLNEASRLLLKDNPVTMRPFMLTMLHPVLIKPWESLATWFQSDDPKNAFNVEHGRTLWEYTSQDAWLNKFFNDGMGSDTLLVSRLVATKCKAVFEGLESVVDVGGNNGTMARAIAEAFPHMQCTVYDLPHVAAVQQGGKNLSFVGGDMFKSVPPADAIMMKCILHDWSDEDCVKILKNCRQAISSSSKGGKVIIIEIVMDSKDWNDHDSIETQMFWDLKLMVEVLGKERSEKEWAKIFTEAGFSGYKINPVLGLRALIEVFP